MMAIKGGDIRSRSRQGSISNSDRILISDDDDDEAATLTQSAKGRRNGSVFGTRHSGLNDNTVIQVIRKSGGRKNMTLDQPYTDLSDSNEDWMSDIEDEPDIPSDGAGPPQIRIERRAMDQPRFHDRFQFENVGAKPWRVASNRIIKCFREFDPWKMLLGLFPILQWLPIYKWKEDLLADISAGFTVAVMHIPQGMGYAMLASVTPIVGIYTAFFPVIIYIFMGTSKHASLGTFAVVSILMSGTIQKYSYDALDSPPEDNAKEPAKEFSAIQVSTAMAFLCGLMQILFGLLRLGKLCSLLSHCLIRGFTTGAAVHVFTSQIKYLIGVTLVKDEEPFSVFKVYQQIGTKLNEVNYVTTAISATVIIFLEVYTHLLEAPITKRMRGINFPIHLLIVIIGVVFSYALGLKAKFGVDIVGTAKAGLPAPTLPPVALFPAIVQDVLVLSIVSYVITYSLGVLLANKHGYKVHPDQELLALGTGNVFASFFSCLPVSGSLSRTLVQERAGSKTLMTSAVSVFILLWVLLFAGPLFEPLPSAVLSAIIVHALKGMFKQFSDIPSLFNRSFSDLLVWISSFLGTVLFGVDKGLLVGLGVNLLLLLKWSLDTKMVLLGETDYLDLNIEAQGFHDVREFGQFLMIKVFGHLNFSNSAKMIDQAESLLEAAENDHDRKIKPRYLILDVGGLAQVDGSGCDAIVNLHKTLRLKKIKLALVSVTGDIWKKMESCDVFQELHRHRCYPTMHDALTILKSKEK